MIALKGGVVVTVTDGIITNGMILIDGDKIVDVGANLAVPDGVDVIDAGDCWVTPGFIDANSHISVDNEPNVLAGPGAMTGDANELTGAITPHVRAIDSFHPQDFAIKKVREAGFTTCFTGPGAPALIMGAAPTNVVGGVGFGFKLNTAESVEDMELTGTSAMQVCLGEDVLRFYAAKGKPPMTRMGAAALLRDVLLRSTEYLEDRGKEDGKPKERDFHMEAMLPALRREMKVRFDCCRADDIITAIRIAEEFNLDYYLGFCTEVYKVLDIVKDKGVFCCLGPVVGSPFKEELWDSRLDTAARLENAGIDFCLCENAMSNTRWLPWHVGVAMAHGLSEQKAFEAVTINPARIMGVDKKVGALKKGMDADIAVFNGHPFSNLTLCKAVLINGFVEYNDL